MSRACLDLGIERVGAALAGPSGRAVSEPLAGGSEPHAGGSDPPSADLILSRDQDRLLDDERLAEEPADEDRAFAAKLLERFAPEQLATALARVWRSERPAPEDGFAEPPDPGKRLPSPQGPSSRPTGGAWFRLPIGRRNNADPRWLLPLICRMGGVGKAEIGAIRIFDRETKFEVAAPAAAAFAEAVRTAPTHDPRIEPTLPPNTARR